DDNPTIGLVLCTEKSEEIARYMLGDKAIQIFASKYPFYIHAKNYAIDFSNQLLLQQVLLFLR
uniref:PDDEXK nuclease domain-containing protein n=1 Tax=Legionella bozemanae TaxID=447 RepID=UPI001041871A